MGKKKGLTAFFELSGVREGGLDPETQGIQILRLRPLGLEGNRDRYPARLRLLSPDSQTLKQSGEGLGEKTHLWGGILFHKEAVGSGCRSKAGRSGLRPLGRRTGQEGRGKLNGRHRTLRVIRWLWCINEVYYVHFLLCIIDTNHLGVKGGDLKGHFKHNIANSLWDPFPTSANNIPHQLIRGGGGWIRTKKKARACLTGP